MLKKDTALNLLKLVSNPVGTDKRNKLPKALGELLSINLEKYIDDKKVLALLKAYELDKPDKMLMFLIESLFSGIESISSQVASLGEDVVDQTLGELDGINLQVRDAQNNPHEKEKSYNEVKNKVYGVMGKLKRHIQSKIEGIRVIDNQQGLKWLMNVKQNEKIINTNIKLIRLCIDALENTAEIYLLVGKELNSDTSAGIYEYKKFYDNVLLNGDTCRLLQDYEFKDLRSQEYFLRLPDRVKNIEKFKDEYKAYLKEVDSLDGYEDILFES